MTGASMELPEKIVFNILNDRVFCPDIRESRRSNVVILNIRSMYIRK